MGQMIAELVKAAGELVPEETSAHHLRHTFARSYLTQYPGDLVGLATLLGHSSLDTTRLSSQPSTVQLATRVEHLSLNAYSGQIKKLSLYFDLCFLARMSTNYESERTLRLNLGMNWANC